MPWWDPGRGDGSICSGHTSFDSDGGTHYEYTGQQLQATEREQRLFEWQREQRHRIGRRRVVDWWIRYFRLTDNAASAAWQRRSPDDKDMWIEALKDGRSNRRSFTRLKNHIVIRWRDVRRTLRRQYESLPNSMNEAQFRNLGMRGTSLPTDAMRTALDQMERG